MSKLSALKSAESLVDFAELLDTPSSALIHVLYRTPEASKYITFDIAKKSGGTRTIHAPVGKLKFYQRALVDILYDCVAELESANRRKPLSHGFRKERSIFSNASQHKRRRFVFNLDLEDFFPTFHFGRVRGFFIKDRDFALKPECATILAQIACFQGSLPQGSPCSPIIADLITHILDVRLVRFAKQHRVTYSRYADDLTFSTNEKTFPKALASISKAGRWEPARPLLDLIESFDFRVNLAKTRMHVRGSRQTVTGLTVNEKVNISQAYWRTTRSMCHALFQTGTYYKPNSLPGGDNTASLTDLRPLKGMLAHIQHIKNASHIRPTPEKNGLNFYGQRLHEDFHFYDNFVNLGRPVIITEGKTDPIYLRNAIQRLSKYQPVLGQATRHGFEYGIKFFNCESTVAKILRLTGGSDLLKTFAKNYPHQLKRYKYKPLQYPTIILLDNDSGLTHFGKMVQGTYKINVATTTTNPFYHLTDNLYLVKTPELGLNGKSCIEDMFDAKTKAIPLDGKVFHPDEKTFDATKHINKAQFAKIVVPRNAAVIDWTGFNDLLDRIYAVIDDYVPPT